MNEQITRIQHMEQYFNQATTAVKALQDALELYKQAQEAIRQLTTYYDGPLWRQDFEADAAGQLPPTLRRGVLSEDGLWNLLSEVKALELQSVKSEE